MVLKHEEKEREEREERMPGVFKREGVKKGFTKNTSVKNTKRTHNIRM